MTNARSATSQFVTGPSRKSRTGSTFRLHLLMEERTRLEIGERITQLRERSPYTQPEVADKLGIGLRAYQKLEKEGTTRYERCQELANIHEEWAGADPDWNHVSAGWIWDGRERDSKADLMGSLKQAEGTPSIQGVEAQIAALRAELLAAVGVVRSELEDLRSQKAPAERKRGSKSR
jgi:transcriptional regulator with XRE-family HTH domain